MSIEAITEMNLDGGGFLLSKKIKKKLKKKKKERKKDIMPVCTIRGPGSFGVVQMS